MAITKTVEIKSIRYSAATTVPLDEPECVWVEQVITIDDPEDDQLPIVKHDTYRLYVDSDTTNETELVQKIHSAVFNK